MNRVAEIFYGVYWRIPKDEREEAANILQADDDALFDKLDELCKKGAHLSVHDDGTLTLWYGIPLTELSEAENGFDEMSLLRVMNLDKGNLHDEQREEMKRIIEDIPYEYRDHLSKPGFYVAWSTWN